MLELASKILWFLLAGAFGLGAWVAGIQLTLNDHSRQLEDTHSRYEKLDQSWSESQNRMIDILGRMDERLKNIERRSSHE